MRTEMLQHTHNIPKRHPKDKHPSWQQLGKNSWASASLMDEFERIICTGPKDNFFWASAVENHTVQWKVTSVQWKCASSAVEMCL